MLQHETTSRVTRRDLLRQTPLSLAALLGGLFTLGKPAQARPAPEGAIEPGRLKEMIDASEETARTLLRELRPLTFCHAAELVLARYAALGQIELIGCAPDEPIISCHPYGVRPTAIYLPEGMEAGWRARAILFHIGLMLEVEAPELTEIITAWDVAAAQRKLRPVGEAFVGVFERALLR